MEAMLFSKMNNFSTKQFKTWHMLHINCIILGILFLIYGDKNSEKHFVFSVFFVLFCSVFFLTLFT